MSDTPVEKVEKVRPATQPPLEGRLRAFDQSPIDHFEAGFHTIHETRMKGLPILNPRLSVKADNFRRWGNDWIGTVVTPWSILVVLACGSRGGWVSVPAGATRMIELPGGDFPFLGCIDPILGEYQMLGLLSPLHEIEDQAAAEAIAAYAITEMLTVPESEKMDIEEQGIPLTPLVSPVQGQKAIPIKAVPTGSLQTEEPKKESKPLSRRAFFRRFSGSEAKE